MAADEDLHHHISQEHRETRKAGLRGGLILFGLGAILTVALTGLTAGWFGSEDTPDPAESTTENSASDNSPRSDAEEGSPAATGNSNSTDELLPESGEGDLATATATILGTAWNSLDGSASDCVIRQIGDDSRSTADMIVASLDESSIKSLESDHREIIRDALFACLDEDEAQRFADAEGEGSLLLSPPEVGDCLPASFEFGVRTTSETYDCAMYVAGKVQPGVVRAVLSEAPADAEALAMACISRFSADLSAEPDTQVIDSAVIVRPQADYPVCLDRGSEPYYFADCWLGLDETKRVVAPWSDCDSGGLPQTIDGISGDPLGGDYVLNERTIYFPIEPDRADDVDDLVTAVCDPVGGIGLWSIVDDFGTDEYLTIFGVCIEM